MVLREHVPLSTLTTFKVGGTARYVADCLDVGDVREAVALARGKQLPFMALGEGSNLLAPDAGYPGVVIRVRIPGLTFSPDGTLVAGAGVSWDSVVREAGERSLWGIENLAGIPGTIGAAPVQNIGAYGAELADTLLSVRVYDTITDTEYEIEADDCGLGYRESRFKREPGLIITQVALALTASGSPRVSYKDLAARIEAGERLSTPSEIASAVRSVRSVKFPNLEEYGTGGSFFKNPVIPAVEYETLRARYPEMPGFVVSDGIKIPLAWILDHVLSLRGYARGPASLFERQPLVLVTKSGARAQDVDALAEDVAQKVFEATDIRIEREVRSM